MDLMPDFILAMGDEESDEMMYEVVKDFSRGVKGEEPGTPDATVTTTQGGPTSPGRRGSYQVHTSLITRCPFTFGCSFVWCGVWGGGVDFGLCPPGGLGIVVHGVHPCRGTVWLVMVLL